MNKLYICQTDRLLEGLTKDLATKDYRSYDKQKKSPRTVLERFEMFCLSFTVVIASIMLEWDSYHHFALSNNFVTMIQHRVDITLHYCSLNQLAAPIQFLYVETNTYFRFTVAFPKIHLP